jgi:hypothetical protein
MVGETMPAEIIASVAFVQAGCWGGPETILLVENEGFVRLRAEGYCRSA